jgi:hypothetical protein
MHIVCHMSKGQMGKGVAEEEAFFWTEETLLGFN